MDFEDFVYLSYNGSGKKTFSNMYLLSSSWILQHANNIHPIKRQVTNHLSVVSTFDSNAKVASPKIRSNMEYFGR